MISAPSGTAFVVSTQGWVTGLVGTIGVAIYDDLGNVTVVRSTANIRELVASSGVYQRRFTDSLAAGYYNVVWNSGTEYATEELQITA